MEAAILDRRSLWLPIAGAVAVFQLISFRECSSRYGGFPAG